jgi:hypothetical protein
VKRFEMSELSVEMCETLIVAIVILATLSVIVMLAFNCIASLFGGPELSYLGTLSGLVVLTIYLMCLNDS